MKARLFICGWLVAIMCYFAGMASAATNTATSALAQVPIEFRNDLIVVRARVNGSDPLAFLIDTGFGINTIHPAVAESLQLQRSGHLTIIGIGGNEEAATYSGLKYDFGGVTYAPRRVASLPSDAQHRRRSRDGILGAGFFRRFVVAIDPTAKTMTLHEPKDFKYDGTGEVIPLKFEKDTPIIEADVTPIGKSAVHATFEVDTGCDDALCLGQPFVEAHSLIEGSAANSVRKGVGGDVQTRRGKVEQLQLGKLNVTQPTANFFLKGSPSDEPQAGHIGMGALRNFRVIFDYERKRMILEPLKPH